MFKIKIVYVGDVTPHRVKDKRYMFVEWISANNSMLLTRDTIHSAALIRFQADLTPQEVGQLLGGN